MKTDWMKTLGWTEDHLEEFRYAGYSYIRQGRYETALPFFEALVVLGPENSYDIQTLGALYVQLNQPEKAIKYLDRALQLNIEHAATLLNMAKAFFMAGRTDEGVRLAKLLKNDPNRFIASNAQALILAYSDRTSR